MTEKRFSLSKDTEWWFVQDNTIQVNKYGYRDDLTGEDEYRGLHQELTEQETVDLLNELSDENEHLKIFLEALNEELSLANRDNDTLEEENKQLKQFKEKVFSLIDKEIARNEEAIEWGKETGADSGAMEFYNHMLKKLQKELQE